MSVHVFFWACRTLGARRRARRRRVMRGIRG
jgi:hypothetical protein